MRLSTAERYVGELICVLDSIYSGAKIQHPSQYKLSEEVCSRIYSDSRWKRLPEWAKSKISHYKEIKRTEMINRYVGMFYIGLDGRKIPTHKAWDLFTEEERQNIRHGITLPIHHLWMRESIQLCDNGSQIYIYAPTDKVYYCSKIEE